MSTKTEYVVQFLSSKSQTWEEALQPVGSKWEAFTLKDHEDMLYPTIEKRVIRRETTETVITEGGAK